MDRFEELLDEAFYKYASSYTLTGTNYERVTSFMAADTMNNFSDEFRELIAAGFKDRFNALGDVYRDV